MNDFYRFRAEAGDEPAGAELLIFDVIGNWEDIGEVSAKAFARDLAKLPSSVKRLDIHINSPGGSLFEASAIYSRLADHRSKKMVYIDGLAASAASIVAMVGHKIYIRENAQMMIHLPSGLAMGSADDMRKMATALDSVTESMLNVYANRTGQDRTLIREMLAAETWFSPAKAVEHGFADEVRGVVKAAAMIDERTAMFNGAQFDVSRFHNVPAFAGQSTKGRTMPRKPVKNVTEEDENDDEKNGNGNGDEKEKKETQETPPAPAPMPQAPAPAAATASDEVVMAERARVNALLDLDRPATHDVIVAAIKDGRQPADVIKEVMAAMDKAAVQQDRRSDSQVLDGIPASDVGEPGAANFGVTLTKAVKSRLKHRGLSNRLQRN
jgi:ATP-dependent protease ClpP protease subunit